MSPTYHILGSSSGFPQAERACSGYALEIDGRINLIDCGGGLVQSFLRSGLDPLKLDRIFISHTHPDHCSDLPLMIQLIHLTRRENRLDIYVPEEYVVPLGISLRAMYLIPERFAFPMQIHGYSDRFEFNDSFKLTALANGHLQGYAEVVNKLRLPNQMHSHSFLIEVEGKRIFHSADITCWEDITKHASDCDLVITELTHVDVDSFLEWAKSSSVKKFVITHLGNEEEVASLAAKIKSASLEHVTLADDGMKLGF